MTLVHIVLSSHFTALAAGCIIYVVVFEILQRERAKVMKPKIVQFIALVAGFATMMTVDLLSKLKICNLVILVITVLFLYTLFFIQLIMIITMAKKVIMTMANIYTKQ